jgi:hypothetical protein
VLEELDIEAKRSGVYGDDEMNEKEDKKTGDCHVWYFAPYQL